MYPQSAPRYLKRALLQKKLEEKYGKDHDFKIRYDEDLDRTSWYTPEKDGLSKELPVIAMFLRRGMSYVGWSDFGLMLQHLVLRCEDMSGAATLYRPTASDRLTRIAPLKCFVHPEEHSRATVLTLVKPSAIPAVGDELVFREQVVSSNEDVSGLCGTVSDQSGFDYAARLICLTQEHSFKPLNVTSGFLQELMTEHGIGPDLIDIVSSFRTRAANVEDAMCVPFKLSESDDFLEYMYVFKYPEQTSRPKSPWYLRQTACYHQFRLRDQRSTYVLISPYPETRGQGAVTKWLRSVTFSADMRRRAFEINQVLFHCYLPNYRPFTTWLEDRIETLAGNMLCIGLEDPASLSPSDMIKLSDTQMRLLPQKYALQGLIRVLDGLDEVHQRWTELDAHVRPEWIRQWTDARRNHRAELASHSDNAAAVLEKCDAAIRLLGGILEFHNRSIASEQSARVERMSKFTADDSITVRVVTTITLVFLSFATVAAIIAMPLFYLNDESHELAVSPSIWIYVLCCVVLSFGTLGYWRWRILKRKRERFDAEKMSSDVC